MKYIFCFADDAMESYGFLRFEDDTLKKSFLSCLSTMQKNKVFCDVILHVRTGNAFQISFKNINL